MVINHSRYVHVANRTDEDVAVIHIVEAVVPDYFFSSMNRSSK